MISRLSDRFRNADADLKEVLHGSAVAFAVKILAAGSAFAMNVVVARKLGASEAGLFFLAFTLITIISAVSRLGLDQTFVRFISAHRVENDWSFINGLYRTGMIWSLLASLAAAFMLWSLAEPIAVRVFNKPEFAGVLAVMAWGIPLMALYVLHTRALQGLKRIPQAMFVLSVGVPLGLAVLVFAVSPESAARTGWLYLAAALATLAVGFYWWRQVPETNGVAGKVDRKMILASAMPLLAVTVFQQITAWSSQVMLGAWSTSADVAVFNAAQRTAMLTSFVLVAVNSISAPKFAELYRLGQHDALRRTAKHATRLMVLLALGPLAIMLLFPDLILWFFGEEFTRGSDALRLLAIGQFINVAAGSVGFLLSMTGREKLLRNNTFFAALLALGLGVTLIPAFGIMGAAVATACAVAAFNLLSVWQVKKTLGFNTLAFWKE
ncbi:MAG: flippase [Pseudomonadota bacterium]|nr:flippase [Pseudomonadota bacterium]